MMQREYSREHAGRMRPRALVTLALMLGIVLVLAGCSEAIVEEIVERGNEYHLAYTPSEGYDSGDESSDATSTETTLQTGTDLGLDGLRALYDDTSDDASVTVMVYMIGSDLETYDASASDDIKEMLRAELGDNVHVVIETGGAKSWHFSQYLDTATPQRWVIEDEHLSYLGAGTTGSMASSDELAGFISWAAEAYPADRNILILWDHGGGTTQGYGWDELYESEGSMSLLDLHNAMVASGVRLNFVGYDACLLGTIEMAYAMEPVADYLIASEETEPGFGWSYAGFLTKLSENPAIDTVELAEVIVGDFIDDCERAGMGDLTLSCVDLREAPHLYECLSSYFAGVKAAIEDDNTRYADFSRARSNAKEFGTNNYDQVDIIDMVTRTDFPGTDELVAAINSAVKYRGASGITGANGLAMYFPYSELDDYADTVNMLGELGFDEPLAFYDLFVAVLGGQSVDSGGSASEGTTPLDGGTVSSMGWEDLLEILHNHGSMEDIEQLLENFTYEETVATDAVGDTGEIPLVETDEGYELQLSDEQWETVSSVEVTATLVRDDDMVLLGSDDALVYSSTGNPLITTSGYWLGIAGNPVMLESHPYEVRDGAYYYSGSIPALLNGTTMITIEVAWPLLDADGNTLDGSPSVASVLGYRLDSEDTTTLGHGYHQFHSGDAVSFLFESYDLDGELNDYVTLGPAYMVRSQAAMTFSYVDLWELYPDYEIACWGTVTDVYQNTVYTETVWE